MPENLPNPNIEPTPNNQSDIVKQKHSVNFHPKTVILMVLVLLIAIGGILLWKNWKNIPWPKKQQVFSVAQIRTIFSLPSSTIPSFQAPQPNQTPTPTNNPITTNNNGPKVSARQLRGPEVAGAETTEPPIPTPTPTPQNDNPMSWIVKQDGNTTYYLDQNGQQQAWVESYPQDSTTLNDIQQTLANSSSVKAVYSINLNGQPALLYKTYSAADNGIALISNNKIYYLHGAWANPEIAKNFQPS